MKDRLGLCRGLCALNVLGQQHRLTLLVRWLGAELSEGSVAVAVGVYWAFGVTSVLCLLYNFSWLCSLDLTFACTYSFPLWVSAQQFQSGLAHALLYRRFSRPQSFLWTDLIKFSSIRLLKVLSLKVRLQSAGIEVVYCMGPLTFSSSECPFSQTHKEGKSLQFTSAPRDCFSVLPTHFACFLLSISDFLRQSKHFQHTALRDTTLTVYISYCQSKRRHQSVITFRRGKWEQEAKSEENNQFALLPPNFLWLERCLAAY